MSREETSDRILHAASLTKCKCTGWSEVPRPQDLFLSLIIGHLRDPQGAKILGGEEESSSSKPCDLEIMANPVHAFQKLQDRFTCYECTAVNKLL